MKMPRLGKRNAGRFPWPRSVSRDPMRLQRSRRPVARQKSRSPSALACLRRGDYGDGDYSMGCEGAIADAEQDRNRTVVPIGHGEGDMSLPVEISGRRGLRPDADGDRLAAGEAAVAVAQKDEDAGAWVFWVLTEDAWKTNVEIAIFIKMGHPH